MSKFSAIVCDHCDKRDVLENPPTNGIKTYNVMVLPVLNATKSGQPEPLPNALTNMTSDLCDECYKSLTDAIFTRMTQVPRAGNG